MIGKQDLIKRTAEKSGKTIKDTGELVNALLEVITETLHSGEEIRLTGFGSFSVVETAARTGVNPRTREKIDIPAGVKVKFSAGKELAEGITAPTA